MLLKTQFCSVVFYFIPINISFQTGYCTNAASYTMGNEDGLPGIRQPGQEFDCLPLSSAKINKNEWNYTCSPPYAFMV
jgi:hypothetical protein